MHKLDRFIDLSTKSILLFLMSLMIVLVFSQVIFRFFIGWTPFFIPEVSRGLLVWVGCSGAGIALRLGQHIGVDFFVERLP